MRDAGRKNAEARWIASAQPDAVRAGDADRDAVGEQLKTHHAAGRLTDDEFQQRLEASMSARTFGELRALTADLPREPMRPDRGRGWRDGRPFGRLPLLPLLAVLALVWAFAGRHAGWFGYGWHRGYGWQPGGGPGYGAYHHPHFPWALLIVAGAVWFAHARRRLRYARYWAMRERYARPYGEPWAPWV